ncbi:ABC transporter ATP-binding protein [Allofustis seminis]|uniref:ABC transporter ATP-binding protein n=1 Tax=Allofustis seminis TaxID=166939 RepID=UPI00035F2E7E|nr:ABC transporter ATP-binding protein [Allofustis seminis]
MFELAKKMDPRRVTLAFIFIVIQVVGLMYTPTLTADIINNGVATGNIQYIIKTGVVMIVVAALTLVAALLNVYFSAQESQHLGETIRNQLFEKIMSFSNEELDHFGVSTLVTRTTNDVTQYQIVMMFLLRFLMMDPIRVIVAFILAFLREPKMSFIFFIMGPTLAGLVYIVIRTVSPKFRMLQWLTDRLNQVFREGLTGIRVIRAFNKDEFEEKRFDEVNEEYAETAIRAHTVMAFLNPLMIFAVNVTQILIVWFGAQFISMDLVQVGNLVALNSYAMNILMGIMMFSMVLMQFPRASVAAERILEVLHTDLSIEEVEHPKDMVPELGNVTVEFQNVSFSYPGAEKYALENISFKVSAGERLAIIGGTGSGKSTLANLLLRLYDVNEGRILINGVDIREMSQHNLREWVNYATQKAVLFSGDIRQNLRYANPDATDEDLWRALEVAQGADFVSELKQKLEARVEQGGSNFSGGQRQRLSIARTLASKAPVLVFDDSFSALDFKTDAHLRRALKPFTQAQAVIVIAQRISSVTDADQILVLDYGQQVGLGTHQELKAANKVYQEIIDSQMKGDDI